MAITATRFLKRAPKNCVMLAVYSDIGGVAVFAPAVRSRISLLSVAPTAPRMQVELGVAGREPGGVGRQG